MTTPDHPARPSPAPGRRTGPAAVARTLVGVAVAAALVVWGLPWVSGVGWGEIGRVLRAVPPAHAIGFQALMLAALGGYAITLAASLPGLSWPRALVLNLAGSAVSKVAPGGGAVGLAATFGIARSWGHRTEAVATSALVTGVWNLVARLAMPLLGVALLSLGMAEWNTPYLALLLLLIAVSLACGAVNATLVLAAGLPPLLATLSTSVAFTGLTDLLTGQRRIAVSDPLMVAFRDNDLFGIPWPLIYLLAVFALFQFLLHHSRFGQHLQAVGGNRDMAQMSGLNVRRLTIIVWLLAGIAAGLAILPLLSQGSGSSSGTATPLLLETVLATFIGAAFSRRRVVTIWGALLGAVLVNALSNGLGLLGVNIFWMGAIKGGLILVVLAASAVRHKGGH